MFLRGGPGTMINGILNSLEGNLGQDPRYASVKWRLEATNMQKRMEQDNETFSV